MISAAPSLARTTDGPQPPFTVETQIAEPVREWLCALPYVVGVGEEVNSGSGIADLVAGCTTRDSLPTRLAYDDPLFHRVLELAESSIDEHELRLWAPHGWSSLCRRVIAPMITDGHLSVSCKGLENTYKAISSPTDPFESLIAVELKLTQYRRAVSQAGRYRLFAERSYIALPAEQINKIVVAQARRNEVGVLSVAVDGSVREELAVSETAPLQPMRRRWMSEQLLRNIRTPGPRSAGSTLL